MAVVVDAQPDHVPAGVVREGDAEDGEGRLGEGFAAAPEEGERPFAGVDVARCLPGQQLPVGAVQALSGRAVRDDGHAGQEIGVRLAQGVISARAALARQVEEQGPPVLGRTAECEKKNKTSGQEAFPHTGQLVILVQYKYTQKRAQKKMQKNLRVQKK